MLVGPQRAAGPTLARQMPEAGPMFLALKAAAAEHPTALARETEAQPPTLARRPEWEN
jgi:hypothetical protein